MLSVAVVVRPHPDPLLEGEGEWICPDLLFRQATLHHLVDDAESREVPLTTLLSRATEHLLANFHSGRDL